MTMQLSRENLFMIIGAAIVTILQLVLAPYIAVEYAAPNFMATYAIVVAVVRPNSNRVAILAFVMGLLYNLFVGGPVGALAIALLVVCVVCGRGMIVLDNDTKFMPLFLMLAGVLVSQLVYAIMFVFSGSGISLGDAILYRALPCSIYDIVIGFVLYLIMSAIAAEQSTRVSVGGPTLLR